MEYSLYHATVPVYVKYLRNLRVILEKAQEWKKEKKIEDATILGARLAVDMLPLVAQVRIASDNAKSTEAQLAGVMPPKMADTEDTLVQLMKRCDDTVIFLETLKPEQFTDAGERKITLPYFPGKYFLGKEFVGEYGIPNFFFHVVTAYDILRHLGLQIGKSDYVGGMTMYDAK